MSNAFSITEAAYTKRRELFEFCRWVNDVLLTANEHPQFSQNYFEQGGEFVKKLLEEAIPIMRLGLHLYRAPTQIYISCTTRIGGVEPSYDGIIEIKSPSDTTTRKMKVEVTATENHETALVRELLANAGFAYLSGKTKRDGGQIIQEPEMVDVIEKEQAIKSQILGRLKKKVESGKYGSDTAILVYVTKITSITPVSLSTRAALATETWNYLSESQADLAGVYYCFESNQAIDEIESWPRS